MGQRRLFAGLRAFVLKAHAAFAFLAVGKYLSGKQLTLVGCAMVLIMRNLVEA